MKPSWVNPEQFFHWHIHSVFSMRDGLLAVDDLVNASAKRGQSCVALTDHGSLSGVWQLYEKTTKAGMKPIIGCELYVSPEREDLLTWRDHLATEFALDDPEAPREAIRAALARCYHLVVLAINETGYRNLIAIHNEAWKNGFYRFPRTTKEILGRHSEGLVASTACYSGEIPQLVARLNMGAARRCFSEYQEIFGRDNFFMELMLVDFKPQLEIMPEMVKLALEMKAPFTVTCDAHYLKQDQHQLHFWVLNVGAVKDGLSGAELKEAKKSLWEMDAKDLYMKTVEEFYYSWKQYVGKHLPDKYFQQALEGIASVQKRVERYYLEHEPKLPHIKDAETKIDQLSAEGFQTKLKQGLIPAAQVNHYLDRLAFELDVIKRMRAVDYMLIFSEVAQYCRDENISMGPGRGSAAGSLVSWLLGITGLDPIAHGLLFERFLNIDRLPSMRLDIDP